MPAGQGESHLSTLFADVHYYFNDPSSKPLHHRFVRASYVYLFHNAVQQRTKIEIANHAGTPDQDAFFGYLNHSRVRYSYKQPTLFTFILDAPAIRDTSQWHLASYDEHNASKYMFKLHTMDIYLWTEKDASTLLNHLKNILPSGMLDLQGVPKSQAMHTEAYRDSVSPVVQQLERTAISSNFPPRTGSTVSTQSFPGPPTSAVPNHSAQVAAPMAYNPAAPAAPEPIAHREKTPPPLDDGTGTGLKAAAKYDNVHDAPYAAGQSIYTGQQPQQSSHFPGPPQVQQRQQSVESVSSIPGQNVGLQRTQPGGFAQPAPQQRLQSTPSFGPFAQSTISAASPPAEQLPQRQPSFGPVPTQHTNHQSAATFGYQAPPTPSAPPVYTAQSPLQSPPSFAPPPTQLQQPPTSGAQPTSVAGFGSYSYGGGDGQPQGTDSLNQHGAYVGDMHSQLYRPTAEEAAYGAHNHSQPKIPSRKKTNDGTAATGEKPKLEDSFGRLEGKVGKYLNKLDKLW